jgi:hypothetical protein
MLPQLIQDIRANGGSWGFDGRVKMPKHLPITVGIALTLLASSQALAAQTQLVNHNDSVMRMQIGNALDGVSTIKIYYDQPSDKMRQLVKRGDLFSSGP